MANKPLYKVLNEERTQGEWSINPVETMYCEIAVQHPLYKEGRLVKHGIKFENICRMQANAIGFHNNNYQEKVKRDEANAKYTALAVNNLHILAEALEYIVNEVEQLPVFNASMGRTIVESLCMNKAKEALSRIS